MTHLGHDLAVLLDRLLAVDELVTVVDDRVQRGGDALTHGVHLVQVEDAAALGCQFNDAGEPDQALDAGDGIGVAGRLTEQVEVGHAEEPEIVKIGIG